MEIIIVLAVIALIAVVWARDKADKSKDPVDTWEPPKEMHLADKPWPYGEKLPVGKIHVKSSDLVPVAPADSEDRVETPAPALTVDGHGDVHEVKPVKKAPAKKPAAKPVAAKTPAKRAPAKKKST